LKGGNCGRKWGGKTQTACRWRGGGKKIGRGDDKKKGKKEGKCFGWMGGSQDVVGKKFNVAIGNGKARGGERGKLVL